LNSLRIVYDYIKYLFLAGSKHSIHSPFVYQFFTKVILTKKEIPAAHAIEQLRMALLKDQQMVQVEDHGAGSHKGHTTNRTLAQIAKNSLKSKKYSQLLYRLSTFTAPKNTLELGTSLGISTAYLSKGNPQGNVTTIEGCPELVKLAQQHLDALKCTNVQVVGGTFEEQLSSCLEKMDRLDLVFFDGNHQLVPTLNYFNKCLSKIHNDSLFIFDDIYWSKDMKKAWRTIQQQEQVTVTIDLFAMGLVFFRKEQEKQHFKLRF
jgi:predicted O-methyltransferase YrrM